MKRTMVLLILTTLLPLASALAAGEAVPRGGIVVAQSGGDGPAPHPPAGPGTGSASYDLTWGRVAGGGETLTTGGRFALGGTIGQPDPGLLSGGDYTLGGGFWGGGAAPDSGSIDWWVMGGGGGSGSAGGVSLDSTLGQAVAGAGGSGDYVVCAGFWYGLGPCGKPPGYRVYLPLVLQDGP